MKSSGLLLVSRPSLVCEPGLVCGPGLLSVPGLMCEPGLVSAPGLGVWTTAGGALSSRAGVSTWVDV